MSECRLLTKRLRRDVPPTRRSGIKTTRLQDAWMRQQQSPEVCLLELAVIGTERDSRARTFTITHIQSWRICMKSSFRRRRRKLPGAHQRKREPSVANYRVVWSNYLSAFIQQSNQQRKIRRDSELEPLVCTSSAYHLSLSGVEN